jgi:hypothetical protein
MLGIFADEVSRRQHRPKCHTKRVKSAHPWHAGNPDGDIGLKRAGLSNRGRPLSESLTRAQRYRACVAECVELAKAATSNEIRSHHYAIAEHYQRLAEAEEKLAHRINSATQPAEPASKPR